MRLKPKHTTASGGENFILHTAQPVGCALGQIIYAGTKIDSQATYAHAPPPDFMRESPHYLLVYTLEGEADYRDDTGVRTVLRQGSLLWSAPGVNQSYGPRPGSRWSEFFVWFNGPIFDAWQEQGLPGKRSRQLHLAPVEYWLGQFRSIVQPPADARLESPMLRLCRLQQMLAEALQMQEAGQQTIESVVWCETACKRLAAGSLTAPSLAVIAGSMNISYTLFRRRFHLLTGQTPGQYRAGEIIRRACTMLLETETPLAQIADELGFHDPFHFSKHFKQRVGLPPSEFRRQILKSATG